MSKINNQIRAYGKSELAHLYYQQNVSDRRVRAWMEQEINRLPELMAELQQAGYSKNAKIYTPMQVKIIFSYIGRP